MTRRLSEALIWTVVLVLIVLAMTGCARGGATSTASTASATAATAATAAAPEPTSTEPASIDPAVWAAVRFEQAQCSWDWHRPRLAYIAALQALATSSYGAELATQVDQGAWQREVVAGHEQVSCTVTAPHRLPGAPSTATSVYVRMSVAEQVNSAMGTFDGGDRVVSLLAQRVADRWLVAGTFSGG